MRIRGASFASVDSKTKAILFGGLGHLTEEGIAVCVDAIRSSSYDDLPAPMLRHIDGCVKCKRGIVDTLALVEDESYEDIKLQNRLHKVVGLSVSDFSFAYRIAAIIIVGISVGILVYLLQSLKSDRDILSNSKKSVEVQQQEYRGEHDSEIGGSDRRGELADNFANSSNLESLLNSVPRSASASVHSPKIGEIVGREIVFDWTSEEGGTLRLKILSNRSKELYSFAGLKSRLVFTGSLKPGLYYWKLEDKKSLLYVGKFIVK